MVDLYFQHRHCRWVPCYKRHPAAACQCGVEQSTVFIQSNFRHILRVLRTYECMGVKRWIWSGEIAMENLLLVCRWYFFGSFHPLSVVSWMAVFPDAILPCFRGIGYWRSFVLSVRAYFSGNGIDHCRRRWRILPDCQLWNTPQGIPRTVW